MGGAVAAHAHGCLPTKWEVRSPHMAVCQPNQWCRHRTGLFTHRMDGAITAHGCLPTELDAERDCSPSERMVQSPHMAVCKPNWWWGHRTELFAHRTGSAVTTHGCFLTEWVVQSPHGAVYPPNGWCSHSMRLSPTEWVVWSLHMAGSPTKRVVRSPHMADSPTKWVVQPLHMGGAVTAHDCFPTERVVRSQHEAVRPQNRWCGHQTGMFAHCTGGAVTAHGCLQTAPCGECTTRSVSKQPCVVITPSVRWANSPVRCPRHPFSG